nr:tRNA (adenosine(37)-N6)-threonylcarbamoyltransferase complex dimerization subunit type 1 TsaB [Propionibacterium sp.]
MSVTLFIDTSADVRVGVAVAGRPAGRGVLTDRRAHAEQLMPLVNRALAEAGARLADVDRIVVGVGPGPFTGLRVGVVTATTLGLALGRPVTGVCSLDAVARQWADAGAPDRFVVVSDARRREVYWAVYGADGVREDGPFVTGPAHVPALPLGGPGASLVGEASGPVELDPAALAVRADLLADAGLEPLYLRRPDAELPSAPKTTIPQVRLAMGRAR